MGKGLALACLLLAAVPAFANEEVYYFHNDHLGTPQALSDQSGKIVWTAEYRPFGEAVVNEDPDGDGQRVECNLRFPGQYYDAETGLHYNYMRDYDPGTGRYLEADPMGIKAGVNHLYVYVVDNPISYRDPRGLECDPCREKGDIENRTTTVKNIIHIYHNNQTPGSNYQPIAETVCFAGIGYTRLIHPSSSHCVNKCALEHEATHRQQCWQYGCGFYDNPSNEKFLELWGYGVEYECLRNLLRRAGGLANGSSL